MLRRHVPRECWIRFEHLSSARFGGEERVRLVERSLRTFSPPVSPSLAQDPLCRPLTDKARSGAHWACRWRGVEPGMRSPTRRGRGRGGGGGQGRCLCTRRRTGGTTPRRQHMPPRSGASWRRKVPEPSADIHGQHMPCRKHVHALGFRCGDCVAVWHMTTECMRA